MFKNTFFIKIIQSTSIFNVKIHFDSIVMIHYNVFVPLFDMENLF